MNKQLESALEWISTIPRNEQASLRAVAENATTQQLQALATAFNTLHDCALKYANEDAWTGQFSKDGRQDLWLYGEGKATAVQALKSLGDIVN